jgi:hypothetical protein
MLGQRIPPSEREGAQVVRNSPCELARGRDKGQQKRSRLREHVEFLADNCPLTARSEEVAVGS